MEVEIGKWSLQAVSRSMNEQHKGASLKETNTKS